MKSLTGNSCSKLVVNLNAVHHGFWKFMYSRNKVTVQEEKISRPTAPVHIVAFYNMQDILYIHFFVLLETGVTLPVQYMGAIPGVLYQTVGPPLFNAPPLMLPNVIYQHTAVQSPIGQIPVPLSDGEKRSGAESEHELLDPHIHSGKVSH